LPKYIAQYEIIKQLGSGTFGSVSLGVGSTPGRGLTAGRNRFVALKQLHDDAGEEAVALLEQEFAMLDQVKHRCIVRVFEFVPDENTVVMEYIHGVDLRTVLDACAEAREPVFTEAAVEICCEVADALYQAWTTPGDNGEPLELVHRDLKPENILLTASGDVKILDFGLACVHNAEWAEEDPDRIRGTPIYMAPEQARGEAVEHHSDLFSLGLIAYELFTNRPAYRVPNDSKDPLGDVFEAIEEGALQQQVRELESKLPAIGPVLAKLLQANPRNRYSNGQDLLVDLRRQLYRDRGAYLKEFCEFFFESIHELDDAPDLSDYADRADAPKTTGRKSIAERLRSSINESQDQPAVQESDDGFLIASGDEPKAKVRHVGSRAPDETGMLEMFTIDDVPEVDEATGFMALPTKRKRPQEAVPSTPKVPQSVRDSEPAVAITAPPPQPTAVRPPTGPSGGISGPTGGIGGPTSGGISGPSGGIGGPTPTTPARGPVGANQPPPASASSRTKSNRIYAIILGLVALIGIAVVFAVRMSPSDDSLPPQNETHETPTVYEQEIDEEIDEEIVEEEPRERKKSRRTRNEGDTKKREPKTPPPPKVRAGTMKVKVVGGKAFQVKVACGSSFSGRGRVSGSVASISGVPASSCSVVVVGKQGKATVKGGNRTVTCTVDDARLVGCK